MLNEKLATTDHEDRVEDLHAKSGSFAAAAEQFFDELQARTIEAVRRRPAAAIVVAVGVGLLLGAVGRRR